jgi:hypothetical protein
MQAWVWVLVIAVFVGLPVVFFGAMLFRPHLSPRIRNTPIGMCTPDRSCMLTGTPARATGSRSWGIGTTPEAPSISVSRPDTKRLPARTPARLPTPDVVEGEWWPVGNDIHSERNERK